MTWRAAVGTETFAFTELRDLLAKATPGRSGDELAGIAAESQRQRVAAQFCLADIELRTFLAQPVVPVDDEVTDLIHHRHDPAAFAPVAALTVGEFRDHLLAATPEQLTALATGLTPEMVAAVSKIMRNQDLVAVAARCHVTTAFRDTLGLPGRLSSRIQPNHPTDDPRGIAVAIVDGLAFGCGDACIGINPATDSVARMTELLHHLDDCPDGSRSPPRAAS